VYVTSGRGGLRLANRKVSRTEHERHLELLAVVAHLRTDARYCLRVGKVSEIGRAWSDGSAADHLLVSLPYPYGPHLSDATSTTVTSSFSSSRQSAQPGRHLRAIRRPGIWSSGSNRAELT
jgi:hypothetical protein